MRYELDHVTKMETSFESTFEKGYDCLYNVYSFNEFQLSVQIQMLRVSVHCMTLVLFVCLVTTLFTCFTLSVYKHQVPLFLPTISETGNNEPERSIFSIGFAYVSFMLILLVALIYQLHYQMICQAQVWNMDAIAPCAETLLWLNKFIFGKWSDQNLSEVG